MDEESSLKSVTDRRPPPVWIFGLLVLPYAVFSNGFLSNTLSFLLRRDGVPVDRIADEVALMILPSMLYFLWSPITDFWIRRRAWNAAAAFLTAGLLLAAFRLRSFAEPAAEVLLFLASCAVMLTSSAIGGLMAAVVPESLKTRASAIYQGGSLGFGAVGGGGMLMLAQHMARGPLGLIAATVIAVPGLLSLAIAEPPVLIHQGGFQNLMIRLGREFKGTFLKWSALPVLLLLCSPLGSGAAQGLLPSIAVEYGVSGDSVAWMNGVGGGLLLAAGAFLVAFVRLPDDLRPIYAMTGLLNALSLAILCVGHPRPALYFLSVTLYLLSVGAAYALFTALVMKLLGLVGKSGSSRYAIAVSLGNAPVTYMTWLDGRGYKWFGVRGLPGIDAAVSGGIAICFLLWLWWSKKRIYTAP